MSSIDNNTNMATGVFESQARAATAELRHADASWADDMEIQPAPKELKESVDPHKRDWRDVAPYSFGSESFYDQLTNPGQMITIAAPSGHGKSLLATNCAAHAIQTGARVLWLNLDMSALTTNTRLASMLTGVLPRSLEESPDTLKQTMEGLGAEGLWRIADYRGTPLSDVEWRGLFDDLTELLPFAVVVIDAFDRLAGCLTPQEFTERCHFAATWAKDNGVCLITTSQTTRRVQTLEIYDVDDLAYCTGKAYGSDIVLTIGHGEHSDSRTVCVVKDREGTFADRQVFRLRQSPSLRLEVVEVDNALSVIEGSPIPAPEYVNCSEREIEILDADTDGNSDGSVGTMLYHGTRGHVSMGRQIFDSAVYKTRDWASMGRLLSLYEMAALTKSTLYAPNTRVPVTIQRGQIMTSARMLGKLWVVDKNQAERFLEQLERNGLIVLKQVLSNDRGAKVVPKGGTKVKVLATIVTLCHYDTNNGACSEYGRQVGQKSGQR